MSQEAKSLFAVGLIFLILTIVNALLSPQISPSFQRAELLSGIASTCLILIAFLWNEVNPKKNVNKFMNQKQGLVIIDNLSNEIRNELAWGTKLLLTATPAATILIHWDGNILIRRGILGTGDFVPGTTCYSAQIKRELVSLANTKFFPAKSEFDSILENLPSIIIYPLVDRGWVILGGYSEKCFSRSDEKWIAGWSDRLIGMLSD